MTQTAMCFVLTDDERLAKKGARLFTGIWAQHISFVAIDESQKESRQRQNPQEGILLRKSLQEVRAEMATIRQNYFVFVDLDAKTFNPFEAARFLCEDEPSGLRLVGFAVALDPHLTQRAKLHGARDVFQRFTFEKLLRELADNVNDIVLPI